MLPPRKGRFMRIVSGPTILTADGIYFDYDNPISGITLNAVARGLANTCRFAGQCNHFYSVAEHSVWVSRIVPPEFAEIGLLHDAAEAFICDMPKPLKNILPDYRAIEARVEAAVFGAFGFANPLPAAIKEADMIMLRTEQQQIMKNKDKWKWAADMPRDDIVLECLSPDEAYAAFMSRAAELGIVQ